MNRPFIFVGMILAVSAAGAWIWLHDAKRTAPLVLQGNVDVRQADLAFKVSGRIHRLAVEEGDKVTAGQVLAELETADFEADLAQVRGQLAVAEANLAELLHGSRPEEIDQARAQVNEGESALVNARLTFRRQQDLLRTGNTPQSGYDQALAQQQQAEARLAGAKAALALAIQGPRTERIEAARGQVAQSRAAVALAEQHLSDTRLLAPEDGVILSRVREPGTIAAAGDVVFTSVLTHPTWIRAYVAEPSLERIHPGMAAAVRTDGGKTFNGRVGYISPLAEFTPKTVQTPEQRAELVYRLRVVVDQADESLRQGMPVSVSFPETAGK
ncbi:efflux RND transporter periplasmic adaptor subunit [Telmatospirillum siberiense]|uniref:Secretion protein HlyD n=1 Tax=Telmatospirillum siberiense TaxID=382514 RepID=A0A2N3PRV1_9PROT|nr:efflux RND transporter periplasmic adaptor subunit [Telmatospirillum siberiense]PKU23138.1 secretion protein HlyD [Telmatospirillum siberiense]